MSNARVFATTRPAGLPRALLRRLILGNRLAVGARVLVAGDSTGELPGFLRHLHLEVVESTSGGPLFDLVVCRMEHNRSSLTSALALEETAALLAQARPGGCFVLLGQCGGPAGGQRHEAGCFQRHLAGFEGRVAVTKYRRQRAMDEMTRLLRRTPQPRFVLAELRLSNQPVTAFDWRAQAADAARQYGPRPCCFAAGAAVGRAA